MRGISSRPQWDGVLAGRRQGSTPCRRPAISVNDALVSAISKDFQVIRRPELVAEEHLCLAQTDYRYDKARKPESGSVPENGSAHPQAGARNRCGDDDASRPVGRHARAIQYDWHPGHRQAYK
jgi:hypothetical protein